MADVNKTVPNQDGGQKSPEGQQETPMPSVEQKPAETVGDTSASSLPKGVSDRTAEQFEKLKAKNAELSDKLNALEKEQKSVFDVFSSGASKGTEKTLSNPNEGDYIDDYGNLDVESYAKELKKTQLAAQKALEGVQRTQRELMESEQSRQEKEAYAKHSWLNPNSKDYDPNAYEIVKDRVVRSYVEGKPIDLVSIADNVAKIYKPSKTKDGTDTKSTGNSAMAGPISGGRASKNRVETSYEDLRAATIKGDENAIRERIRLATSKK